MKTIKLFNLDLGEDPGERFGAWQIGPFHVKTVQGYRHAVGRMPNPGGKREIFDPETGRRTVTHYEAFRGGWVHTADAFLPSKGGEEQSVLASAPLDDGGVWDLCNLLTFLTGRRVATETDQDRFSPKKVGSQACQPIATLPTAAVAWNHRANFAHRGMATALLMYNEALPHDMLQAFAALFNTSLNVLLDAWGLKLPRVSGEAKQELKDALFPAIRSCAKLTAGEQSAFVARIGAKVDEGLASLNNKVEALLCDLGLISVRGAAGQDDAAVYRRVKYVNTVRNRLTHAGTLPVLENLTAEQSRRHVFAIAGGVVPDIIKLCIGRALNLHDGTWKLLSCIPRDLNVYFKSGVWRGWPLDTQSFEEWFEVETE